jgi:hypothetical protein
MSDKKTSDPVDVPAFAQEVAAALGDGWTVSPGFRVSGDDAYVLHSGDTEGDRFYLCPTGTTRVADRGKVTLHPSVDDNLFRYESSDAPRTEPLEFRASRGAAWVADKIRTTLLPQQRAAVAAARAGRAAAEQDAAARDAIAARALAVLGPLGSLYTYGQPDWVPATGETLEIQIVERNGSHVGDLMVNAYGRLDLKLSLPGADAEQLAAALVALLDPERRAG